MPKGHPDSYSKCQLAGCTRTAASFGYCQSHYVTLVVRFRELEKQPERTVTAGLMEKFISQMVDPGSIWTPDKDDLDMIFDAVEKAHLCFRERGVLKARYGIGEPAQSLLEVGRRFKVTRERVRQIETKALCKLRRWINLKLKLAGEKGLPI